MPSVVADTHTIIWYFQQSTRLSLNALTILEQAIQEDYPIYLASISVVEVAYLVEKGKLPDIAFERLMTALIRPNPGLIVIPLDLSVAQTLRQIPRDSVPDMPDRIIAATALWLGLPLVTCDRKIQSLTVIQTIW